MSNFAKKVAVSMCSINMAGITTLMKKQVLTKFSRRKIHVKTYNANVFENRCAKFYELTTKS